jgi:4-hydroxybenzoate polyprenyltransferase
LTPVFLLLNFDFLIYLALSSKTMNAVFRFFVYSNLFIATCAILMVNQTCRLLLHAAPGNHFLGFVFSSTICSYSFHWYLTSFPRESSPRIEWLKQYRPFHLVLFFAGLIAAAYFFYFFIDSWYWVFLSVLFTFLYSAPKIPHRLFRVLLNVAIGKTIFLAFVWTYVTSVLPFLLANGEWTTAVILFFISRFFFIYAICIMFDYRDREEDKAEGIRSMITYFSEAGVDRLFFFSLLIYAVSTIFLLLYDFSLLNVILLLIPGVITALIYNYSKKNFSDVLYYFVLDGLMMLSALLMLVIKNPH